MNFVGGNRCTSASPAEHNPLVGLSARNSSGNLATGKRPINVGIVLCQETEAEYFVAALLQILNYGVGKMCPFVAADGYFHIWPPWIEVSTLAISCRIRSLCAISLLTFSQPCIIVVWSRPPSAVPTCNNDALVSSRIRY